MKTIAIIPARYQSSRFPGKPLIKILNKPMIIWVIEIVEIVLGKDNVFVATDDKRIFDTVKKYEYNALMTSDCKTGTDRVAEASKQVNADIVVNVQGDEPLLNPEDIEKVIETKKIFFNEVINGMSKYKNGVNNKNVVKVVADSQNCLLYMSRSIIPCYKDLKNKPKFYWKQSGLYAFNKSELNSFENYNKKGFLENIEDVEILRFVELGIPVKMVEIVGSEHAVDIPEDVQIVEKHIRECFKKQ